LSPIQMQRAERLYRPPAIFAVPCAHEQARLRAALSQAQLRQQHERADSLYAELFRIQPDDTLLRLGWARQRLAAGDDAGALALLQALQWMPGLPAAWLGQTLSAKGDALWGLRDWAAADSCFGEAARLAVTRDERRSLQVRRQALADAALREPLREYLTGNLDEAGGLGLLARLRATQPRAALPRYLLGRRLYYAERFDAARMELEDLPADSLLSPDTRLAALELLILCDLRGGAPEQVSDRLTGLARFDLEKAERLGFEALAARATWAMDGRK